MLLHKILILPDERLRDIIYTAYCRDDPELISRGGSPVRSEISEEALRLPPFKRGMGRTVAVFQLSGEICGHIVAVNPFSGRDLPRRMADAAAVFYDIRSLLQGIKSEFVPLRDILSQPDGDPIHLELASRGDRPDRNRDIVLRIDMHKLCHISPPLPKFQKLSPPGSEDMIDLSYPPLGGGKEMPRSVCHRRIPPPGKKIPPRKAPGRSAYQSRGPSSLRPHPLRQGQRPPSRRPSGSA